MAKSNSTISRRTMLAGAAALPALALPAMAREARQVASEMPTWTGVPAVQDPLWLAVARCGFGLNMFSLVDEKYWPRVGGKQALIAGTYGPQMEVLINWDKPAMSLEGAIEALHFATGQCEYVSPDHAIKPMIVAVLKFLEHVKQTQQA